jgi:nitrate reductase (NAD(P)H)
VRGVRWRGGGRRAPRLAPPTSPPSLPSPLCRVINHLNINSAILAPAHDAVVPLATDAGVEFRGYAYSGGGRKVTRVELSTDKGATWRPASIERVEPPTAHGMHWTWVWWRLTLSVAELAACGEVALRAADSSMNVQPSALTWSLLGMMGNQHYVVRTAVHRSDDGALGLRFQHPAPIQAGALGTSGWREEEAAAKAPTEPATPPQSEAALPSRRGSARVVARAELERHTGDDSVWFAYRGKVYDGTAFLDAHPGGADSILIAGGQDATEDFDAIHSAKAKTMLDAYYVGELVSDDEGEDADGSDGADAAPAVVADLDPPALDPRKKVIFRLISRTALSPNVVLLRFGLPTPTTRLGLPVGKHVFLYGTPATGEVVRAYTPTSSDADRGAIDFVVKMYDDSLGGGVMSRWLGGLKVGDAVAAKGPVGHFVYEGAAACVVNRRKVAARSLTFIAAGTGITPCYAVLRAAIDEEGKDGVPLHLLYANRHEDDVLLMDKLDELQQAAGARLTVTHTLSRPKETWPHRRGRIDAAMLADVVPKAGEGRLVLLCGPRALVEDVCKPAMKALGHADENVVVF